MKLRMPSIPLITNDPYFSVWSYDDINASKPTHWTGAPNTLYGTVEIDGTEYCFLGKHGAKYIKQVSVDADAFTTTAVFENGIIRLTVKFTTPALIHHLYLVSRPVSFIHLSYDLLDGNEHTVFAKIFASEELVLNRAGDGRAYSEHVGIDGLSCVRMGKGEQTVLGRKGDDVRIDWGYLYLAARGEAEVGNEATCGLYGVYAKQHTDGEALFLLGYDDIDSIEYFGKHLKAYWKTLGKTITEVLKEAADTYEVVMYRINEFCEQLTREAVKAGGEKYADLLQLAYRQVMGGHKLVVDENGELLYISKECFSNGCAATVDVTYPSAPMFLYFNPELLKGMLRPVFRFARSDMWKFDFAPHDVGTYPILNGQAYGPDDINMQMPVEECGNVIILCAAICDAENNVDFAKENIDLISKWSDYLVKYGEDPENQLCTDDFAGHLAHNCNLSLKAIMGLEGYAKILRRLGRNDEAKKYSDTAKAYARSFIKNAANDNGGTRLAYDKPGTFSLKYNAVWDKIWKTDILPDGFYEGEHARYMSEAVPYGVPLDSRKMWTKSDWLLWAGAMCDKKEDFERYVELLWKAFNTMHSRVPMTDWYYADTSDIYNYNAPGIASRGFTNRTVQGGLFIRLLMK